MTPMVRVDPGSTSFASLMASELAKSELAGDTANIKQLSLVMNWEKGEAEKRSERRGREKDEGEEEGEK